MTKSKENTPALVVRDERFAQHLEGVFHLETPKRFRAIQGVLDHPTLAGRFLEVTPRAALSEELAWVHRPAYIETVARTAGKRLTALDLETQATEKTYEVARLAGGAVFSLIDAIWTGESKRGFAMIRPPGHHAERDRAMGFCIFNNPALGACYLKQRHAASRVMIVDIDAHHGNGIQSAFYDTDTVLYVSMHLFPGFPGTGKLGEVGCGRGEGFSVNVPLGKGCGDRDFARILYHLVFPLAREYQPAMILVPCGFDLYRHDRLGGMCATAGGYSLLTRLLIEIADAVCGGRIAFILEGGYSLRGIRECGLRVLQELCGISSLNGKQLRKIKASSPSRFSTLKKVIEIHKKYWRALQ